MDEELEEEMKKIREDVDFQKWFKNVESGLYSKFMEMYHEVSAISRKYVKDDLMGPYMLSNIFMMQAEALRGYIQLAYNPPPEMLAESAKFSTKFMRDKIRNLQQMGIEP